MSVIDDDVEILEVSKFYLLFLFYSVTHSVSRVGLWRLLIWFVRGVRRLERHVFRGRGVQVVLSAQA